MAVQTLDVFFREKQAHVSPADVDLENRRKRWEASIADLYKLIVDEFLAASVAAGSVRAEYGDHDLSRNFLGMHTVKTLVLFVGNERVTFWPKAQDVVGNGVRVDVEGQMGEATLLLEPGRGWMLITQRVPSVNLVPFDADAFLTVLKNVMRP